jgi:hypothetical protein
VKIGLAVQKLVGANRDSFAEHLMMRLQVDRSSTIIELKQLLIYLAGTCPPGEHQAVL